MNKYIKTNTIVAGLFSFFTFESLFTTYKPSITKVPSFLLTPLNIGLFILGIILIGFALFMQNQVDKGYDEREQLVVIKAHKLAANICSFTLILLAMYFFDFLIVDIVLAIMFFYQFIYYFYILKNSK